MAAQLLEQTFGPDAWNRIDEPGRYAALESFYFALNNQDLDVLAKVWAPDPLAQLNNPLGGLLRGGEQIVDLYRRVFEGSIRLQVELTDIVEYSDERHAVFAGREIGEYIDLATGSRTPLAIRTSRYFVVEAPSGASSETGFWRQLHHHGSIDDPAALSAYQAAVAR
ncbi:MAG: YybH family protein [Segniliparus sp.]|uniref:YybH family protein n=1 Tax=Segniliparus sp. TaxID=2804064 RepID=UPI003F3893F2